MAAGGIVVASLAYFGPASVASVPITVTPLEPAWQLGPWGLGSGECSRVQYSAIHRAVHGVRLIGCTYVRTSAPDRWRHCCFSHLFVFEL